MTTQLSIHAVQQGGMRVTADDGVHQVVMDYPLQAGVAGDGLTPLQMLLASLAACSANSVLLVLKRRLEQPVAGLEVEARAVRRQAHPTVLTEISLEFIVKGAGVKPEAVVQAIRVSEEQLCPVWNMLKGGTRIAASFRIVEDAATTIH
jgi:putative redox protein